MDDVDDVDDVDVVDDVVIFAFQENAQDMNQYEEFIPRHAPIWLDLASTSQQCAEQWDDSLPM